MRNETNALQNAGFLYFIQTFDKAYKSINDFPLSHLFSRTEINTENYTSRRIKRSYKTTIFSKYYNLKINGIYNTNSSIINEDPFQIVCEYFRSYDHLYFAMLKAFYINKISDNFINYMFVDYCGINKQALKSKAEYVYMIEMIYEIEVKLLNVYNNIYNSSETFFKLFHLEEIFKYVQTRINDDVLMNLILNLYYYLYCELGKNIRNNVCHGNIKFKKYYNNSQALYSLIICLQITSIFENEMKVIIDSYREQSTTISFEKKSDYKTKFLLLKFEVKDTINKFNLINIDNDYIESDEFCAISDEPLQLLKSTRYSLLILERVVRNTLLHFCTIDISKENGETYRTIFSILDSSESQNELNSIYSIETLNSLRRIFEPNGIRNKILHSFSNIKINTNDYVTLIIIVKIVLDKYCELQTSIE